MMENMVELDRLTVLNLVDNETDGLSSACQCCHPNQNTGVSYKSEVDTLIARDGEYNLNNICYAGHGLSLLLIAELDGVEHHLLFDGGPDPKLWEHNAKNVKVDLSMIEAIVLSHYHIDHSGGLRSAVPAISKARIDANKVDPVLVDLHDSDCVERGITIRGEVIKMAPDNPTKEELTKLGAKVERHDEEHTLCDGFFYVSGFIPRITEYETGIPGHHTRRNGKWEVDENIDDERYVACSIKGRGVVVFSACSHAGIINVCKDVALKSKGKILGVLGGFHLSGSKKVEKRIQRTVKDLVKINPRSVFAGHCTGFRAKAELYNALGDRFQPCVVGGKYMFHAADKKRS